ncbi:MAG: leucyl/phenylalanyl-tRNA--protein transferase [Spirochaetota bacterium]
MSNPLLYASELPYLDEHTRITFPPPREEDEYGIVLVGGNLSPGVLLSAYEQGVFPWYDEEHPILWWNPPWRCVLLPGELHISRSMRRFLRRHPYQVTRDTAFEAVITACQDTERPGQEGTWLTEEMVRAYIRLFRLGYAHSYEVWHGTDLVGGLYGVRTTRCFCGESMFSRVSNTSKLALWHLHRDVCDDPTCRLIDFQITNPHSESLGAHEIPRKEYQRLAGIEHQ